MERLDQIKQNIGQSYFNNDGAHFYWTFQPIHKTMTTFSGLSDTVSVWESKGLSNETFTTPFTSNKNFSPKLVWWYNCKTKLEQENKKIK